VQDEVFEELTYDEKGRINTLWYKESYDLSFQYKYDDKKGIFSSVNALFFYDPFLDAFIANWNISNPTEVSTSYKDNDGKTVVEKTTYSYTYNDNGYPVMITNLDEFGSASITITYIKAK
jgi:hypothetical protein